MQGRSWDTDVENKRMDTKGRKLWWGGDGGVLNWATGIDMYTSDVYKIDDWLKLKKKEISARDYEQMKSSSRHFILSGAAVN